MQQWKTALLDHSFFLHDNEAVQKLVDLEWPEFPHLHKLYRCIEQNLASSTNLGRWLMLYRYGGVYAAIDSWPGPGVNEETIQQNSTAFFVIDTKSKPSDGMFALEPRHPVAHFGVELMLAMIANMAERLGDRRSTVKEKRVLNTAYQRFVSAGASLNTIHNVSDTLTTIPLLDNMDNTNNDESNSMLLSVFLDTTSNTRPVWGSAEHMQQSLGFLQNLDGNQPRDDTMPTGSCVALLYSLDGPSDVTITATSTTTSGSIDRKPSR